MAVALLCLLGSVGWAQNSITGTVTGTSCLPINVSNRGVVGINVKGTWSGTLQAKVQVNAQGYNNLPTNITGGSGSTITGSGAFQAGVSGYDQFELCGATVTGTATISMNAVSQSASSGGSGSGTVTQVNSGSGLTGGPITSSGTLSCVAATGGTEGCVTPDSTATDFLNGSGSWGPPFSLTTTGSSGAATFSGGTLNIPQYTGGGTPGGSSGTIQYNNGGSFGGVVLTQGYELTGAGSSAPIPSPAAIHAEDFCSGGFSGGACGSGTMDVAITAACTAALSLSGEVDARAFYGNNIWSGNTGPTALYCGQTPGSRVSMRIWFGPQLTLALDGPPTNPYYTDGTSSSFGASSYGTPAMIIPNGTIVYMTPLTNILLCGGSNLPITGCTHAFPQRALPLTAINVSCGANSCTGTYTTSTTLTSSGGPTAGQNIYPTSGQQDGEWVFIRAETGTCGATCVPYSVARMVQTVPSSTTFTVTLPLGTSTTGCASSCGNAYLGTPAMGIGTGVANDPYIPQNSGSLVQGFVEQAFNAQLWYGNFNLENSPTAINAGLVPHGAIAFQNVQGGENTFWFMGQCQQFEASCLQVSAAANDSGPYDGHYFFNTVGGSPTTVKSTAPIIMSGTNRGIHSLTTITAFTGFGTARVANGSPSVTILTGLAMPGGSWNGTTINLGGTNYTVSSVATVQTLTLTGNFSGSSCATSCAFYQGVSTSSVAANEADSATYIDGGSVGTPLSWDFTKGHNEWAYSYVWVGANRATQGGKIEQHWMQNSAHNAQYGIYLDKANAIKGVAIENLSAQPGALGTGTIYDAANAITCTDLLIGQYRLDLNGKPVYDCVAGTGVGTIGTQVTGATVVSPVINATTGFQVNGAATNNNCLVGNGTNFVSAACPTGSGTVSGQASGVIPLGTSATAISNQSHMDDGNTTPGTITSSEPLNVNGAFSSTGPTGKAGMFSWVGNTANQTIPANQFAWGGFSVTNATAYGLQPPNTAPSGGQVLSFPTPTSGWSQASWITPTQTIASGTAAMGTSAISSGTCATVVTVSATGVATTDAIIATPNADPTGVTGYAVSATGSLYIQAYPTANNVNFKVCNNTSGSLTPAALTLNWRVVR